MSANQTAADQGVERLVEWGIDTVFDLPGDGIDGVMESLRTRSDRIRFVHVRHEETAALAACVYGNLPADLRPASRRPHLGRSAVLAREMQSSTSPAGVLARARERVADKLPRGDSHCGDGH